MAYAKGPREVGGALRGVETDRVAGAAGEREHLRDPDGGTGGGSGSGEGAGEPGHVVAAAGPRGRPAGRRGHEPRGAGPVGRHRVQHGEEVPGQRRGEVAAAALLVAEEGRAQRARCSGPR